MSDNSESNKRLAKNSIFLSIRMVFVLLISLYTTRVLLSTLGVTDYGVYNVVCGFVSMFTFLNASLSNGIQRFYNFELGKNGATGANKVYNTSLLIQALLAIIIVIVVESIGIWYIANKMVIPAERLVAAQWIFQFVIVSLVFNIMQAPYMAAVMAHERMGFYAIMCIVDAVLKLFIVFVLPYLNGDRLIYYGFLWMLISISDCLVYFYYCRRNFKEIRFQKPSEKSMFKSMLNFSGWNMFGTISSVLRVQGLNLIMNFFFGPVVNAARGVAGQINGGIQGFVQNITTPVRPQVIQSYAQGNIGRTMNLTYSISKLSCFFIAMLALPICFELDFVLKLWLGNNIPEHTTSFAVIIIMCSFQGNLNAALSTIVHATGKMKKYQFWCSLVKLSSVPAGYLLLSIGLQPEYALLAVFVFDWLGHFTGMFIIRKLIDFSIWEYVKKVIIPVLCVISLSIVIITPFHYFIENEILRFALVEVIGALGVFLTMYYIGLIQRERELVKNMVKSLKQKIHIWKR